MVAAERHNSGMRQLLCPVVVGRDEELAAIDSALTRAAAGQGGAVFLVGEAGVGKSRMVREASTAARDPGMAGLTGGAVSDGRASALRALSEALLGVSRFGVLPRSPEIEPFRGYLARILPEWREIGTPLVEGSDVLLAEGVLRLLRLLSGGTGILLVLE